MATTIASSTLTTQVSETITINGTNFNTTTEYTVQGITNYVNNIMNLETGSQGFIIFSRAGVAPRNTEYNIDDCEYIRLTNSDDTNNITITLEWQSSDDSVFVLAPGGSFILTEFTNAGAADTLGTIKCGSSAAVDVPYVIALKQ